MKDPFICNPVTYREPQRCPTLHREGVGSDIVDKKQASSTLSQTHTPGLLANQGWKDLDKSEHREEPKEIRASDMNARGLYMVELKDSCLIWPQSDNRQISVITPDKVKIPLSVSIWDTIFEVRIMIFNILHIPLDQ